MMDENGRSNSWDILCRWDGAVERNCRCEIRSQPDCESIGDVATITEAGDSDLAGAEGMRFQPQSGSHEILGHLLAVACAEQLAALVVVTWKAAHAGESVRRKGHEVSKRQTACYVLDMRIQASIFVDHENAGQLRWRCVSSIGTHRAHEISSYLTVSLRRRNGFVGGTDPIIGSRNLLPQSVVRH